MDRYYESGAISTPPAAPSPGSVGFPTDGNLSASVAPTTAGAHWFHMVTEELRAVVVAAGLTPDGNNLAQLLEALDERYAARTAGAVYWSYYNAAALSATGVVNYQSAGVVSATLPYAGGTLTVPEAGVYRISASATLGYTGGASGAQGHLTIFRNGVATGYTNYWQEQNNTIEISTVSIEGHVTCAAGDTISIGFTNDHSCNVFAGTGTFNGQLIG